MTSNKNNHDERWIRLVDAENTGEYLPPEDRDFLKQYHSPNTEIRVEQLLLIGTAQLGLPKVHDQPHLQSDQPSSFHLRNNDDQVIANVLDQWIQDRSVPSTPLRPIGFQPGLLKRLIHRLSWVHYTGILGTGIATLAVWWFLDTGTQVKLAPQKASHLSLSSVHSHSLYLLSGSAIINQRTVEASSPIPLSNFPENNTKFAVTRPLCIGTWENQSEPAQSSHDPHPAATGPRTTDSRRNASNSVTSDHLLQSRICFTQGSLGNWSSTNRTIVLDEGQADVTTTKHAPSFAHIKLGDAKVHLLDREGQYHIESVSNEVWSISVQSGAVEISRENGTVRNLGAGERLSVGGKVGQELPPSSSTPPRILDLQSTAIDSPTPARSNFEAESTTTRQPHTESEMLAKARRLQSSGDIKKSAAVLQELVSRKNLSDASKVAMLSLGQIYMRLKQPQRALRIYTKYLRSGSVTLIEEAELGRIDALHAIGDAKRERNAIESFLERYPASTYADTLRRKLQNRPN